MNLDTRNQISEAFAEIVKEAMYSEEKRHAVAEKIVKFVQDDIQQKDLSAIILPRDFVPIGQTAEYAVPGKIRVYWHEPGSYAPRTQVTQKVFTIPVAMVSANPEYELGQLEAGRYGTIADQVRRASEALQGAINAKVWNTITGSIATTDANYSTVDTTGAHLVKAALDNAINWVEDQAGGGARAIVGRRNLLYRILDFGTTGTTYTGAYSDQTLRDIDVSGNLTSYRGVPIVPLPQWRDGFGAHTIKQDEIMVMGQDSGKYVVQQELRSRDAVDADTLIWNIHMYLRIGVGVFFPERNYRIQIT